MRVLMVTRGVLPLGPRSGGAELYAFSLARHLVSLSHQVTLIADAEETVVVGPGAPGLTVSWRPGHRRAVSLARLIPLAFPRWLLQHLIGNVRVSRRALAALKNPGSDFDVIHTHGALSTIMIGKAIRATGLQIPLVYTEHDSTPWSCSPRGLIERVMRRLVYRAINLSACRNSDAVVTSYDSLADELARRTKMPRQRFVVSPNGADARLRSLNLVERRPAFRPPSISRYCLFVGSLCERKAPDLLLRALAISQTDLGLVLVGAGPMASQLRRLAKKLAIEDRVYFAGSQPHEVVCQYYMDAEFVVLPSVSETAPLVLIESLALGTPVIATQLDGIATIVRHGANGLLVPAGGIQPLAEAITLLARDGRLCQQLRLAATGSIPDDFTWDAIATRLDGVYSRLTGLVPASTAVMASSQPVAVNAAWRVQSPEPADELVAPAVEEYAT